MHGPLKLLNTERPDLTWRELSALDPETEDVGGWAGCESASLKWLRVLDSESDGGSSVVFLKNEMARPSIILSKSSWDVWDGEFIF